MRRFVHKKDPNNYGMGYSWKPDGRGNGILVVIASNVIWVKSEDVDYIDRFTAEPVGPRVKGK